MTEAEALLLALEKEEGAAEAYAEDVRYCEIDSDLRTIHIPAEIQVLGVENDKEVHRVHFRMPRKYGEFDLSEFKIGVGFENAEGKGNVYEVDDRVAGSDYITFSWLAEELATAVRGNTTFAVSLQKFAEDGSKEKEFNTTTAIMKVLPGMKVEIVPGTTLLITSVLGDATLGDMVLGE